MSSQYLFQTLNFQAKKLVFFFETAFWKLRFPAFCHRIIRSAPAHSAYLTPGFPLLHNWPGIQFVENLHELGAVLVAQTNVREKSVPLDFTMERFQDRPHLAQVASNRFVC
jgi:hypothetical protein